MRTKMKFDRMRTQMRFETGSKRDDLILSIKQDDREVLLFSPSFPPPECGHLWYIPEYASEKHNDIFSNFL